METLKKILGIVIDVIVAIVIIAALFITILTLSTNDNGVPNINGYYPFTIQSNSMYPSLKSGDFIISKKVDITKVKVGDIVSYLALESDTTIIKTHRVTAIQELDDTVVLTTRGDDNPADDEVLVTDADLLGKYNNVRIPLLGYGIDFLSSKWGFLLCIITPLAIMFIVQIYQLIIIVIEEKTKAMTRDDYF